MNRNYISLIVILILTVGLGFYVYSKKIDKSAEEISIIEIIPQDFTSQIIEINSPEKSLGELFNTNLIWKEIDSTSSIKKIENFWNQSDSLFNELKTKVITLYSFSKDESNEDYILLEFLEEPTLITLNNWNSKNIGNHLLFTKASEFPEMGNKEKAIDKETNFISVFKTKGNGEGKINVFRKSNKEWSVFDLSFLPEQIFVNGFVNKNDHTKELKSEIDLGVFSNIPSEFKSIKLIHFDSLDQLRIDSTYITSKSEECKCDIGYDAYNWIESPSVYFQSQYQNASYVAFKLSSISSFKESMNAMLPDSMVIENDDNSLIRSFDNYFDYNSIFRTNMKFNYFMRIDDYVLFSEEKIHLERVLFQQFSNSTIDKKEELYSFLKTNINKNSYEVEISGGINYWNFDLESGIGIVQSHVESETLEYKSVLYSKELNLDGEKTNPKWELQFSYRLSNKIYLVKNHRTDDKDYIVQDKNNFIHFITPNGEIKWKKDIGNPIIGKIKNIDILGNSKYQLVFNTKNRLYILDVLGNNVGDFPVNILDSATANVSIMDYDKDLNFRFLLPTTKGIKSIDKNGKIVEGWAQPTQINSVISDINHLLINNLDYIQAQDSKGDLYFYNRRGEVRHTVLSSINNQLNIVKGSSIEQTRVIYFDSSSNEIKRKFFSDKSASILFSPSKKIKQFFYFDFDGDKNKDFILVFDNELIVYGQDLRILKKFELPNTLNQLSIWEGGFGYINQFGDLTLIQGEDTKLIEGADSFRVDFYKNTKRVIIRGDNSLKLIHI